MAQLGIIAIIILVALVVTIIVSACILAARRDGQIEEQHGNTTRH